MNSLTALYSGDGGRKQEIFIQDLKSAWKHHQTLAASHLRNGTSHIDYLESSRTSLTGQARVVLTRYLQKWDHQNKNSSNVNSAIRREADREKWRQWYKNIATYDLGRVHNPSSNKAAPRKPDEQAPQILEPPNLLEFIETIESTFATASAGFFDDLKAFRGRISENLMQLTVRFDEVLEPLVTNGHTTPRNLAFVLRCHLPAQIRRAVGNAMDNQDKKRYKAKQPGTTKDELVILMREAEAYLFNRETEQRAAGVEPNAKDTDATLPPRNYPKFKNAKRGGGGEGKTLRERLGVQAEPA